MHSAKYAFAAGVECSRGTLVIMSSRTFFMTPMSSASNWGMDVAPDRPSTADGSAILTIFFKVGCYGRVNNSRLWPAPECLRPPGPAASRVQAVAEAERAIDRALAPKNLKLI